MKALPHRKIAILGPGLLGGSLALALRARLGTRFLTTPPPDRPIVALWGRRAEVIEEAKELNIADEASTDLAAVVKGAGLIIFCTPVEIMAPLAERIAPHLLPGTLLTDVGSVKAPVVEQLAPLFEARGSFFIGSHPMAGSEQSGLHAAQETLFEGSTAIITPHDGAPTEAVEAIRRLWSTVGCRVEELSPALHDRTVGLVSHLPHFLAAALVDFVNSEGWDTTNFCGNGFRDTTRIASGPAEMWSGIFAGNREAVVDQLERFTASLAHATESLKRGDNDAITAFLSRAKAARDTLNFPSH